MTNLLALCKTPDGAVIKRIQITQPLQDKIGGLFQQQAIEFMDGIEEEVAFGTDWRPDSNEILVMDAPAEVELIQNALDGNVVSLPIINSSNFLEEGIKGLFVALGSGEARRLLVQSFTAQQVLSRRFALFLEGEVFRELTEPSFTLENELVAIVENGRLRFKSFHKIKLFEIAHVYQEATDQQIEGFCAHANLVVADVVAFKGVANQGIRKLVHAIATMNVLDEYSVEDITAKAAAIGLVLTVQEGRIVMPTDRKGVKEFLTFLDDAIYEAPLSAKRYMSSGKRPFGSA